MANKKKLAVAKKVVKKAKIYNQGTTRVLYTGIGANRLGVHGARDYMSLVRLGPKGPNFTKADEKQQKRLLTWDEHMDFNGGIDVIIPPHKRRKNYARPKRPEQHAPLSYWGDFNIALGGASDPMPELPGENEFIGHSISADIDKGMFEYYNPRFARFNEFRLPQSTRQGMYSLPPHLRDTTYYIRGRAGQRRDIAKEQFAKTYWE